MSLLTPIKIRKLQKSFHAKAKAEPGYRFYSLWDKVCRLDILQHAYALSRSKKGRPGSDGESFDDIESRGLESWLGKLNEELKEKTYSPGPSLRVWIPKSNGSQRPLGIPCIRERVVQMAVLLVINPIFEADLLPEQYGFRSGLDAKMAIRRIFYQLTQHKRLEVVDGDLSDYFITIPHGRLMKCISRRISDGQVLSVIRAWLKAPVVEKSLKGWIRSSEAEKQGRGVPQGAPISPLMANLYFRRLILAWRNLGIEHRLKAKIVNYADDFVICCPPGNGEQALKEIEKLVKATGLTLNEKKTLIARLPRDCFDFLGYSFGRYYGKDGKPYIGTRPSKKALSRVLKKIYGETSKQWLCSSVEKRIEELNPIIRGWCNYFSQGPVGPEHKILRQYTERRLRRWLQLKHKRRGTGYRQYPDKYLYEKLGLYKPSGKSRYRSSAKA